MSASECLPQESRKDGPASPSKGAERRSKLSVNLNTQLRSFVLRLVNPSLTLMLIQRPFIKSQGAEVPLREITVI